MTRISHLLSLAAILAAGCAEVYDGVVDEPAKPSGESKFDEFDEGAERTGDVRVRIVAANITSLNDQAYHEHGIRILQGVHPDIVLLQEFNYGTNSAAELRSFVDQAVGPGFYYYREEGAQIPNGVLSRWPIIESGEWDDAVVGNRDFAWARIDIPGPVDLYAISVHLLSSDAGARATEASSLVSHIQGFPAGSYVTLGGDFNTQNREEQCLVNFGAGLVVPNITPPVDHAGNSNTNASRGKPYDWVLANSALQAKAVPVTLGTSTFTNGAVIDTRVYAPLSDIFPAQSGDSASVNMQHMAIVRDFVVSDTTTTEPRVTVTSPNGGETWAAGSSHDITFTSSSVTNVKVEVALNGTTYTVVAGSVAATAGKVTWTVPSTATTAARVRVSEASTGVPTDTSDGAFTVTTQPQPSGKVYINEIMANEPGSDSAGEFVEVVNGSTAEVDLSGATISDLSALRHTFAAGTKLAAGKAIVVYGSAAGIPSGVPGAIGSSTGLLSLTNSGDTVTLSSGGTVLDKVTYASSLSGTDGVSMNRKPDADPAGTFVLHNTLNARTASPGTKADGSSFGGGSIPPPPSGITAEVEPNNGSTSASGPVAAGVGINASIGSSTDVDWYRVKVTGGSLSVSVAIGNTADLDWYLYRDGNLTTYVARGYTTANPEAGSATVTAGTYYVKVVGYQGATASYKLTLSGAVDPIQ